MMQNWEIDPQKRDYVLEKGAPKQTDSLRIPAYVRLKTRRGEWMYAPDTSFGSTFHLQKKRVTSVGNSVVEDIAADALQPIVDDGRASEISITAETKTRNNVGMSAEITDAVGRVERLTFSGLGV